MDSITHTVLGACIGEGLAGKKLGKQAMFWGAVANNIPDIDVLSSFWLNQPDSLLAHRGFTHSILFALMLPPILAYLFNQWHVNKKMKYYDWWLIFASGMFVHIFIDALTCYGTGWFEPFSHYRVTMNVLFVADPFYTISLLISFVALLIIKAGKNSRKKWMRFGLWVSTLYIVYAFINKIIINSYFKDELQKKEITYTNYFTTPAPLNNFLWYLVAKNDSGFYIGYHSFFDKTNDLKLIFRPQNAYLLASISQDDDIQKLKRFSKNYYTVDKEGDKLFFSDIRFGTIISENDSADDFVFRYTLAKNADNDLVIQRGRFKSTGKAALASLWKRVFD